MLLGEKDSSSDYTTFRYQSYDIVGCRVVDVGAVLPLVALGTGETIPLNANNGAVPQDSPMTIGHCKLQDIS